MYRENKTFAKLLFCYEDKDLVQVVTWPLAVLHRANFSTDPSFWGRLTVTEVDISKNIVGGFCQTDFESGVYQLRGRLQELPEMFAWTKLSLAEESQGPSLIGWDKDKYFLKEQPAKLFLHEKPSVSLVITSFPVYIGHTKLLTTNQHCRLRFWEIHNGGHRLGDDLTCFSSRQLWRYLHTSCVDPRVIMLWLYFSDLIFRLNWQNDSSLVHADCEHSK